MPWNESKTENRMLPDIFDVTVIKCLIFGYLPNLQFNSYLRTIDKDYYDIQERIVRGMPITLEIYNWALIWQYQKILQQQPKNYYLTPATIRHAFVTDPCPNRIKYILDHGNVKKMVPILQTLVLEIQVPTIACWLKHIDDRPKSLNILLLVATYVRSLTFTQFLVIVTCFNCHEYAQLLQHTILEPFADFDILITIFDRVSQSKNQETQLVYKQTKTYVQNHCRLQPNSLPLPILESFIKCAFFSKKLCRRWFADLSHSEKCSFYLPLLWAYGYDNTHKFNQQILNNLLSSQLSVQMNSIDRPRQLTYPAVSYSNYVFLLLCSSPPTEGNIRYACDIGNVALISHYLETVHNKATLYKVFQDVFPATRNAQLLALMFPHIKDYVHENLKYICGQAMDTDNPQLILVLMQHYEPHYFCCSHSFYTHVWFSYDCLQVIWSDCPFFRCHHRSLLQYHLWRDDSRKNQCVQVLLQKPIELELCFLFEHLTSLIEHGGSALVAHLERMQLTNFSEDVKFNLYCQTIQYQNIDVLKYFCEFMPLQHSLSTYMEFTNIFTHGNFDSRIDCDMACLLVQYKYMDPKPFLHKVPNQRLLEQLCYDVDFTENEPDYLH